MERYIATQFYKADSPESRILGESGLVPSEFVLAADAQRALDAERRERHAVEQIAGQALGYPWFKDDQKNFPGATEADGVCIGEHVAGTIVQELASKLATLQAQLAQPIHICQRCGRVGRDGWVTARYECDELHGSLQCPDCQCIDLETNTAKELAALCTQAQAQLRQVEGERAKWEDIAGLRFAGDHKFVKEMELLKIEHAKLRQLVEALPVVDGRMDVECGACYYIRSFIAGQYGVVCGLITEQSTAMAIKALLEYRATQAAQDAGAKLPAWVNEAMRLAPTQTNPPHPTEERS